MDVVVLVRFLFLKSWNYSDGSWKLQTKCKRELVHVQAKGISELPVAMTAYEY